MPILKAATLDDLKKLMHISVGGQQILALALTIKDNCCKERKNLLDAMANVKHYMPELLKEQVRIALSQDFVKRINYLFTRVLSGMMTFQNYGILQMIKTCYETPILPFKEGPITDKYQNMAMKEDRGDSKSSSKKKKKKKDNRPFLDKFEGSEEELFRKSDLTRVNLIDLFTNDCVKSKIIEAGSTLEDRTYRWTFVKKDLSGDRSFGDSIDSCPFGIVENMRKL